MSAISSTGKTHGSARKVEHALRVALLYVDADEAVAVMLRDGLRDAGFEVVSPASDMDGTIALMSARALKDAAWLAAAERLPASRLIPVRLGRISADAVPAPLRDLNWIDLVAGNPASLFGPVFAGLMTDPARHRLSRQLLHEAETWDRAKRPKKLLIDDRRRAQQMRDLLADLGADPTATPNELTVEFVERSAQVSLRSYRKRRRWRILVALGAAVAAIFAAAYVPKIRAETRVNHAAIVTTGDDAILNAMPEWSAANAATLLLEGTTAQQELGRSTLLQALQRPWAIGVVDFIESVRAMTPFDHGSLTALVAQTPRGSAFAVIDARRSAILWSVELPGTYVRVDVAPDGLTAVVAGLGLASVDLIKHSVRVLTHSGRFRAVRLGTGGHIALASEDGRLAVTSLVDPSVRVVGQFASELDLEPRVAGSFSALVATREHRFAIVSIPSGAVIAQSHTTGPSITGALAPSGSQAIIAGDDGGLWRFGAGQPDEPTGIAVPSQLNDMQWTSDERLVLASESERGQVVYLPRGEPLGQVCWDVSRLISVQVEGDAETVSCVGAGLRSLWRLPRAPSAHPVPGESSTRDADGPAASIETRDADVRISWHGEPETRSTGWFSPSASNVSAVAFSPDGSEIVVGAQGGHVTLLALTDQDVRLVSQWRTPDLSSITAVGWSRGPVATSASGQTWRVPTCAGCQTDSGLLRAARKRFSGCFTNRQLAWIDDPARKALGLRLCPPLEPLAGG
jgi:hypothetical protein